MGGGLVPVLVAKRAVRCVTHEESCSTEDRRKAPSSTPPFPLSLQNGGALITGFDREKSREKGTAGGNVMERRRDLATRKTLTSELSAEVLTVNQVKHNGTAGSRLDQQAGIEKRVQVQHALKALYHSPEIRTEKIEALRAQIKAGTYQINRTSLAMKLLGMTEQDAG
jgi:anti-sigma28 factor (negative regulator of flagellin synthesis)